MPDHLTLGEPLTPERLEHFPAAASHFSLADTADFLQWRYAGKSGELRYFEYVSGARRAGFTVRASNSHGYSEALVGKIRADDASVPFIVRALRSLCRTCSREGITAVSTALANPSGATCAALLLGGFVPARASTPLIVKELRSGPGVADKTQWRDISLEDVDTW